MVSFKRLHVGSWRIRAYGGSRALSVGGTQDRLEAMGCLSGLLKTPIYGRVKLDGYLS